MVDDLPVAQSVLLPEATRQSPQPMMRLVIAAGLDAEPCAGRSNGISCLKLLPVFVMHQADCIFLGRCGRS